MAEPGTEWVEDLPLSPGDIVAGKYVVEGILGRGGMGLVVSARHLQVNHLVALKVLLPCNDIGHGGQAAARFLREAQNATLVQSEHVVRVMDMGTLDGGAPYLVMEYLDGVDFARVLRTRGVLPASEAVGYVLQALLAISEAHARGIIHRDLKPSNLFLCERLDGSPLVKVLDFGVSKAATPDANALSLTDTSVVIGSPQYMSPEQIRTPRDIDRRADIWSLGVILQELITGQPPFLAQSVSSLLVSIVTDAPTPLGSANVDVPPGLDSVIGRCLAKDPNQRFRNAAALAEALLPFCREEDRALVRRVVTTTQGKSGSGGASYAPIAMDGPTASEPFELGTGSRRPLPGESTPRRRRWIWGAAALGIVTVVAFVVALSVGSASREAGAPLRPASSVEMLRPLPSESPPVPAASAARAADEEAPSMRPRPTAGEPDSPVQTPRVAPAAVPSTAPRQNPVEPARAAPKRKPVAQRRRSTPASDPPAATPEPPKPVEPRRPALPPDMSDLINERR
jgi:eukaryotic-like serine/threonine-protein kinase